TNLSYSSGYTARGAPFPSWSPAGAAARPAAYGHSSTPQPERQPRGPLPAGDLPGLGARGSPRLSQGLPVGQVRPEEQPIVARGPQEADRPILTVGQAGDGDGGGRLNPSGRLQHQLLRSGRQGLARLVPGPAFRVGAGGQDLLSPETPDLLEEGPDLGLVGPARLIPDEAPGLPVAGPPHRRQGLAQVAGPGGGQQAPLGQAAGLGRHSEEGLVPVSRGAVDGPRPRQADGDARPIRKEVAHPEDLGVGQARLRPRRRGGLGGLVPRRGACRAQKDERLPP